MSVVTKDIVFSYLAGQGTLLQKKQIDEWLLESDHQETYSEWLDAWERLHPQFTPSIDEAYEKFSRFLESDEFAYSPELSVENRKVAHKMKRWLFASVSAAAAIAMIFFFRDAIFYKAYRTGNAEVKTVELQDHSIVTLNANSVLKVSRLFGWMKKRSATLTGEASFDIRHTPDSRPFELFIPEI